MYTLYQRPIEIVETDIDDGVVQVLEAYFSDDETNLTEKELFQLECKYGCDLAQDYSEAEGDAMYDSFKDGDF